MGSFVGFDEEFDSLKERYPEEMRARVLKEVVDGFPPRPLGIYASNEMKEEAAKIISDYINTGGRIIKCVKECRSRTGLPLKESKAMVQDVIADYEATLAKQKV